MTQLDVAKILLATQNVKNFDRKERTAELKNIKEPNPKRV